MTISKNLSAFCFLYALYALYLFRLVHTATFVITNNCSYMIWAGALPGGGKLLNQGESWSINVNAGTRGARIWPRTGCNFDGVGRGGCQTGDCDGNLICQASGAPPNTVAGYSLNQFNNLDFFYISLIDGFNVPMEFSPTFNGCPQATRRKLKPAAYSISQETGPPLVGVLASTMCSNSGGFLNCSGCSTGIRCSADIKEQCPNELRAPGGCASPCNVFMTDQYCCTSGANSCGPTDYSKFFKDRCPDAYSYPYDDQTRTFTCPGGTNYSVVFCP